MTNYETILVTRDDRICQLVRLELVLPGGHLADLRGVEAALWVGEQRETVRSREQPLDLMSRCIGEMQSPEHPELDHTTLLSVTASGDTTVTTW